MFIGEIESDFRRFLALNREFFRARTLFVASSGNFGVEQLLGETAGAVHSNGISIYSHFLGHQLRGTGAAGTIADPAWAWLQPYFETNPGAAVVLLYELLKWDPEKNHYSRRFYEALRETWDERFIETAKRIEGAKTRTHLTTYRTSDPFEFLAVARDLDPEGVVVLILPLLKGGFGSSGVLQKLNKIIGWHAPAVARIAGAHKAELLARLKNFAYVLIDDADPAATDEPVMVKRKVDGKHRLVYSNLSLARVLVAPHTGMKETNYPLLTVEDMARVTPESIVTIKRVGSNEINFFRNLYLAKTIVFRDGTWSFCFFIDGKLFGFAIANLDKYGDYGLYMLSDFTITIERSKLSKLLLLLLQSTHFRDVVQELLMRPIPNLITTAFTDKPVSMKYRAAWELQKRGVAPDGKKFLNYQTETGLHTDREAIVKWMKFRKKSKSSTRS